jgi:hypothetical protein
LFVRQDLSLAQQIVQTNHATFEMAYSLSQSVDDAPPSIVLIGVPNKKSLQKVIDKLLRHDIEFSAFHETDDDIGLSAVATSPLGESERAQLRNYKLWKPLPHAGSSVLRAPDSNPEVGGSNPSPRTMAA